MRAAGRKHVLEALTCPHPAVGACKAVVMESEKNPELIRVISPVILAAMPPRTQQVCP